MLKKMAFLAACLTLLSGCTPNNWIAKFYIFQAESRVDEAGNLKSHKIPFEKRISFYAQACDYFAKAYERNPEVFTLSRIETAADSCWKANQPNQEDLFRQFEEVYIKNHPQEFEYGDSGVGMMDMGG